MVPYIYIEFFFKNIILLFIDLCQILNRCKLRPAKFINLYRLLIYRVLIYRSSTVLTPVKFIDLEPEPVLGLRRLEPKKKVVTYQKKKVLTQF